MSMWRTFLSISVRSGFNFIIQVSLLVRRHAFGLEISNFHEGTKHTQNHDIDMFYRFCSPVPYLSAYSSFGKVIRSNVFAFLLFPWIHTVSSLNSWSRSVVTEPKKPVSVIDEGVCYTYIWQLVSLVERWISLWVLAIFGLIEVFDEHVVLNENHEHSSNDQWDEAEQKYAR